MHLRKIGVESLFKPEMTVRRLGAKAKIKILLVNYLDEEWTIIASISVEEKSQNQLSKMTTF